MAKKGKKQDRVAADEVPALEEVVAREASNEVLTFEEVVETEDGKSSNRTKKGKLKEDYYEAEMLRLQEELVKLQYWVKEKGLRVVVIFEGRDAAGKGGVIKRIIERTNPRTLRVVALGIPSVV